MLKVRGIAENKPTGWHCTKVRFQKPDETVVAMTTKSLAR